LPLMASVCNLGLIPGELLATVPVGSGFAMDENLACVTDPGRQYLNVFTSMFLHGGWMHLIGNMWFLWLFGNNIEDSMSRPRFLVFYLMCGVAAALGRCTQSRIPSSRWSAHQARSVV
jgi:membrane associated rhomboid family serine protease